MMAHPTTNGRILLVVKLNSSLSEEELLKVAHERAPQFRAIPGLIQKYYVKLAEPGWFGGVYLWESEEALQSYRASDLAATIAQAYRLVEPPRIERLDVLFPLRD